MVYLQIKQDERRRTEILGSNLRVAYSIIFANFCDRELQNRMEIRDDFISKVENNPIELLAAIKEMMHTASHEKFFPYETLWTSLGAMFKLKQGKDGNLADYYDKMKAFSSQVKKYLPNDVLHQFVESLEVYKKASASEQLLMKQGGWKRLVAFGFLYNSDCEK